MAIKLNNKFSDIVESGSNDNGTYVKYSNGRMICTKSVGLNLSFNTQWGSMYELSSRVSLGNFPAAFIGLPILNATVCDSAAIIESINNRSNDFIGNINLMRPVANSSVDLVIHITANGYWKEVNK